MHAFCLAVAVGLVGCIGVGAQAQTIECIGNCACEPIMRTTPFGGIAVSSEAQAEEAIIAGSVARERAERYFGIEPRPFLITSKHLEAKLVTRDFAFVIPWTLADAANGVPRLPSSILPHEIGHQIFIHELMPRTSEDQYGGAAPDWLDEMAAIALEDEFGVRKRRFEARLFARQGELLPLGRLLAMTHPEWQQPGAPVRTAFGVPRPPVSTVTPFYYATIRALFDLLVYRSDSERAVRDLVEEIRADRDPVAWILGQIADDGKSLTLADADRELNAFVLESATYEGSDNMPVRDNVGRVSLSGDRDDESARTDVKICKAVHE